MKSKHVLLAAFLVLRLDAAAATTHYVDLSNTNPAYPYTNWATAATNIQDAIDAAVDADQVLVTNGVYSTGSGTASDGSINRVVVTNALTLQGVNGSLVTIIDGGHTMRCVYLTSGAVLKGFTLTNGSAGNGVGGGVYCAHTNLVSNALVSDCFVISNSASSGGGAAWGTISNCVLAYNESTGSGGGAESCILNNCMLSSNSAGGFGGGASGGISTLNNCVVFGNSADSSIGEGGGVFGSILNNCLVISNSSRFGGGTYGCTLNNCTVSGNLGFVGAVGDTHSSPFNAINNSIIYYNAGGNWNNLTMTNSCTTPMAPGSDNITNSPFFTNLAGRDFHLTAVSPCINAGKNAPVTYSTDLDGNQRVIAGTVDIGAYEFQSPSSVLSYAWAQQHGLPTDGSADFADTDSDGMNNWREWIAGTDPTNPASVLIMLPLSNAVSGVTVGWQSVSNRTYFLQRSGDLGAQAPFSTIQNNIAGRKGVKTYTDTNAVGTGPYFYRVGIQQ
jgi:hypothetical protein